MTKHCDACGEPVSDRFWRVFEFRGRLYACPACSETSGVGRGYNPTVEGYEV